MFIDWILQIDITNTFLFHDHDGTFGLLNDVSAHGPPKKSVNLVVGWSVRSNNNHVCSLWFRFLNDLSIWIISLTDNFVDSIASLPIPKWVTLPSNENAKVHLVRQLFLMVINDLSSQTLSSGQFHSERILIVGIIIHRVFVVDELRDGREHLGGKWKGSEEWDWIRFRLKNVRESGESPLTRVRSIDADEIFHSFWLLFRFKFLLKIFCVLVTKLKTLLVFLRFLVVFDRISIRNGVKWTFEWEEIKNWARKRRIKFHSWRKKSKKRGRNLTDRCVFIVWKRNDRVIDRKRSKLCKLCVCFVWKMGKG